MSPLCRHCRSEAEVHTREGPVSLSPEDFDPIDGECDRCEYEEDGQTHRVLPFSIEVTVEI